MPNKTIMVFNLIPTYWQNFKCLIMSTVGQRVGNQELLCGWWVWIKTTTLQTIWQYFVMLKVLLISTYVQMVGPSISPSLLPEQSEVNLLHLC